MSLTIAFDVYGTLIDTQGVLDSLEEMVGNQAGIFSQLWRSKQLEYSFRRGLMQKYRSFSVCTQQALDYTCVALEAELSQDQKHSLLSLYKVLPAFEDTASGLEVLRKRDISLYAFSNGSQEAVNGLLNHAGIAHLFDGIVSCEDITSFKPNPAVYQHFLTASESNRANTWLVSSNPFDIIGASSHGWKTAWVQRSSQNVFDPWEVEPTAVIHSLSQLASIL